MVSNSFFEAAGRLTALALLALLAPLLAVIGAITYLVMGRPVLFRQLRSGQHGKPFEILKFRTMRSGDEPDEQRLTHLGRVLRASSLDELPSLWNVVRGEVALVGPRPLLPDYDALYSDRQRRRLEVKPGLTGWAQINGRNSLSWDERLELDVWYVEHRTLLLDLKIIVRTVSSVLGAENIGHEGHATMPRFTGSNNAVDGELPAN